LKPWLQFVVGLVTVSVATGLIYGSMLVSLAENIVPSAKFQIEATQVLLTSGETNEPISASSEPVESQSITSQPRTLPFCTPSAGWHRYAVQSGDTFTNLAVKFDTTVSSLLIANCLSEAVVLQTGAMINVPEIPSNFPGSGCGAPGNWLTYYVQAGDNLDGLSRLMRVSVSQLQYANCMGNSTTIMVGQPLKVPILPVFTPTFTFTPLPSATPLPSSTMPSLPTPSDVPAFGIFPYGITPVTPENSPNSILTPEPPSTFFQTIIVM
jgi:LysM repeat protein